MRKWISICIIICMIAYGQNISMGYNSSIRLKSIPSLETEERMEDCWYLTSMNCPAIWQGLDNIGQKPGENIVIAVIDTGLDVSCNELKEALWSNYAEWNGTNGVDDDGNGYVDDIYGVNLANRYNNMTDSDGHGTQMAGVMAMQPENGGSVGVAYGVKIMPIKVSVDSNYDFETIIEGIHYAVEMGADIINMSFATYTYSAAFEEAVREAAKSCVIVAAAGNESYVTDGNLYDKTTLEEDGYGMGDTYPAVWDCCIGVMAYDQNEKLAQFSNWDQSEQRNCKYDIIAPGSQITTVGKSNRYVTYSGTSYATAMVSAGVAILKGIVKEKYSAVELKDVFLSAMKENIEHYYNGQEFSYPKCDLSQLNQFIEGTGESITNATTEVNIEEAKGQATESSTSEEKEATSEVNTEEVEGQTTESSTGEEKEATTEVNAEEAKGQTTEQSTSEGQNVTSEESTENAKEQTTEQSTSEEQNAAIEENTEKNKEQTIENSKNATNKIATKKPTIKKRYLTNKKFVIVCQHLQSQYRTYIILKQKQKTKIVQYRFAPLEKNMLTYKWLRKKGFSKGKITIIFRYQEKGKKAVVNKYKIRIKKL